MSEVKKLHDENGNEVTVQIASPKKALQSKTIRVNGLVTIAGWLIMAAPYVADAESVLKMAQTMDLSPETLTVLGIVLGILGPINLYLRVITKSPLMTFFAKQGEDSEVNPEDLD